MKGSRQARSKAALARAESAELWYFPPTNGVNLMPDESRPNFPGYEAVSDIFKTLTDGLVKQGDIWNDVWNSLVDKEQPYGAKQLLAAAVKSYELQFQTVEKLLRNSGPGTSRLTPTWVNFDLTKSSTTSDLMRPAVTREFQQDRLVQTELAPFGRGDIRFRIKAEGVNSTKMRIAILGYVEKDGPFMPLADNRAVEAAANNQALNGQYVGLIYDSANRSDPPLVIVTLAI